MKHRSDYGRGMNTFPIFVNCIAAPIIFCPKRPDAMRISSHGIWRGANMERTTGIGPAFSAWEANILPLNYVRIYLYHYTRRFCKNQDPEQKNMEIIFHLCSREYYAAVPKNTPLAVVYGNRRGRKRQYVKSPIDKGKREVYS